MKEFPALLLVIFNWTFEYQGNNAYAQYSKNSLMTKLVAQLDFLENQQDSQWIQK